MSAQMPSKAKYILFFAGYALLIIVELLRWLAKMPAETCTALSSIAMAMVGGGAASALSGGVDSAAVRKTNRSKTSDNGKSPD